MVSRRFAGRSPSREPLLSLLPMDGTGPERLLPPRGRYLLSGTRVEDGLFHMRGSERRSLKEKELLVRGSSSFDSTSDPSFLRPSCPAIPCPGCFPPTIPLTFPTLDRTTPDTVSRRLLTRRSEETGIVEAEAKARAGRGDGKKGVTTFDPCGSLARASSSPSSSSSSTLEKAIGCPAEIRVGVYFRSG